MKKFVKKVISHPLIKGSTIIFIGGNIANVFVWLFNLILGRFFTPTDYGIYATLISFLAIFGIFPSTFISSFAKFAAVYKAQNDRKKINILIHNGFRIVFVFATLVLVLLTIFISQISSFLNMSDLFLLFLIFLSLFLSIIISLPIGILTGEMRLYVLSLVSICSPFFKIIIGFTFLFLGFKVLGVIFAMLISSAITFIFLLLLFRKNFHKENILSEDKKIFISTFRKYSFGFLLSSIGITILTSSDMIFVKHYFSSQEAGQYAALSVMGRSIFYLTGPIYAVFFPLIAQKKEKKENIHNTLFLAVIIISLVSVTLSFIYFIFPSIVLNIFFPIKEYKMLSTYLGPFSLYIIIFSIAMLFNSFLLSIGKTGVYKINLVVSAIFILLMYVLHDSFYQIIGVLFGTSLLLLTSHLLYYIMTQDE